MLRNQQAYQKVQDPKPPLSAKVAFKMDTGKEIRFLRKRTPIISDKAQSQMVRLPSLSNTTEAAASIIRISITLPYCPLPLSSF